MTRSERHLTWGFTVFTGLILTLLLIPQPNLFPSSSTITARKDGTAVALPGPLMPSLSQQRDSIVAAEARRVGISATLAVAVSHVEVTGGDSLALSQRGAVGIMQVLPQYWLDAWPAECYGGRSLFDRTRNACVGVRILRQYHQRYGSWSKALCAYHGSLSLPKACQDYVEKVFQAIR